MALQVDWVHDEAGFVALAPDWEALLPADGHPSDQHCWHYAWWQAFGAGSRLAVCTVRRDGTLVGALPLREADGKLLSLTNSHTFTCRPLARDEEAMSTLLSAVVGDGRREIELTGLEVADPGTAALETTARGASMLPTGEHAYASPYINTVGSYEDWRNANKSRWKAPLEKKWRKTERDYEAEFKLIIVPEDLEAELDEGLRIEASGWKGAAGTAIASAPDTALFYRLLARGFAERGELRFSWIILDGLAVSFDYCLLFRNRLYTLKSGFDEDYKTLAPGLVLRIAVVKACFESEIEVHDLLGDEVEWKTRFSEGSRPHVNMRIYPKGMTGYTRYLYRDRVRPSLKRIYRRVRPADPKAPAR